MAREDVIVKSGYEFDHYFPKAKLITITKKKGAKVEDTLLLIPKIIRETAFHTKRFANEYIKADSIEKTCKNLWHFVYKHIAYKKDEDGKEQVRSPARTWHDRHNVDATGKPMGVDCDCMTVFVVSVLYNLGIKNIFFRITKYEQKHFEHIYPIVILPDGKQITIDCVVHHFNYETPYTEKQDTAMDLEYLNGVKDSTINRLSDTTDLMGIMDEHEALSALGRILKRKQSSGGGGSKPSGGGGSAPAPKKKLFNLKKTPQQKEKRKEKTAKTKKFLGKGLHVTNRINPVTVALRNGVLAGMKLNFMQIASNLRWTYLSEADAAKKGILMDKFHKMKAVREKLEKIFYGAGGKPENLKKAMLTGQGNKDRAVPLNGLGYVSNESVEGLNEDMPLNQLLGRDIYYSENVEGLEGIEGLEGFGELGDLGSATAASVAAASGALATIAGIIKSIGSIFPARKPKDANAKKGKTKGTEKDNSAAGGETENKSASDNGGGTSSGEESANKSRGGSGGGGSGGGGESGGGGSEESSGGGSAEKNSGGGGGSENSGGSTEGSKNIGGETNEGDNKPSNAMIDKAKGFWENNKKWLKPTGIAVGTVGILALTYKLLKPNKKKTVLDGINKKTKPKTKPNVLSGLNGKKKSQKKSHKKHPKKMSIALL